MYTVKGFGVISKAEVDVFLELSCFFDDPADVDNLISGSSAFSKPSFNISKFLVYILLKSSLENFECYFASCEMSAIVWWFEHSLALPFPGNSAGKESTYNAGDLSSIPGLGRSTGEGIGYPLQYSWASLVAQMVMNLPAMWETWVRSLGWEGPLEEGMATHSSIQ